jgi:hypothetical protein
MKQLLQQHWIQLLPFGCQLVVSTNHDKAKHTTSTLSLSLSHTYIQGEIQSYMIVMNIHMFIVQCVRVLVISACLSSSSCLLLLLRLSWKLSVWVLFAIAGWESTHQA